MLVLGSSFPAAVCSSPSSNRTAYHLLVLRQNLCTHTPCSGTSLQQSGILTTGETNSSKTYQQGSLCVVHGLVYMCSAAVLLCVCECRIPVRVRTCHSTSHSSSAPAVQIPSITCKCRCVHGTAYTYAAHSPWSQQCVCTAVCTQLSLCVAHTCVAQQYSCVFACVGCACVFEPPMLPHLSPAFLRY